MIFWNCVFSLHNTDCILCGYLCDILKKIKDATYELALNFFNNDVCQMICIKQ